MPCPIAPPSAALAAQLDAALLLPPEYGAGLSSHLPMALAALDGLGADAGRLRSFAAHYRQRFGLIACSATPAADGPSAEGDLVLGHTGSGDAGAFSAWQAVFRQQLEHLGPDATLRTHLPRLMQGVAAAAFHGAIRTAHAVESAHAGELAAALAYWAVRWMPLVAPEPAVPRFDDAAIWLAALEQLRQQDDAGWRPSGALISGRMRSAAATVAWRRLAGALGVDAPSKPAAGAQPRLDAHLRGLGQACAGLYAATGNFTALHMATGTRAVRVLAPWLDAANIAMLAPLHHAVAAARLTVGAAVAERTPGIPATSVAATAAWDSVRRQAIASNDEHVIKLVHAMLAQAGDDPDPVWLQAAQRALAPAT